MRSFVLLPVVTYELVRRSEAIVTESYSQNSLCKENNCVNPIFPGMNDMAKLELIDWQCTESLEVLKPHMAFCGDIIQYRPSFPSPNVSAVELNALAKSQDDAAATAYFYHINAMGYDPWEYQSPSQSQDSCIRATWRLVCYTYFPKAQAGCAPGTLQLYLRPCKTCCTDYVAACNVECCDESTKCVFEHAVQTNATHSLVSTGYYDASGPSAACTGLGSNSAAATTAPMRPLALLLAIASALHAFTPGAGTARRGSASRSSHGTRGSTVATRLAVFGVLAGTLPSSARAIDVSITHHSVGNWRQKDNYLTGYEFVPPGGSKDDAELNSCSANYPASTQCSGNGYCKAWIAQQSASIAFCTCDRDWADPECRTRRKSQMVAFLLSLFGGFLGLDYFYLGLPLTGLTKLCTLGGLGFWWFVDIVRMGTGPVYAAKYRVAPDLPRMVFVVGSTFLLTIVSGFIAMYLVLKFKEQKKRDIMLRLANEDNRKLPGDSLGPMGPQYNSQDAMQDYSQRTFSGYGATLAHALPNAGAPFATPGQPGRPAAFAGPYGPVSA